MASGITERVKLEEPKKGEKRIRREKRGLHTLLGRRRKN